MNSKHWIIIGGGISGLSVLYHLRQALRERHDVTLRLLERNAYLGGSIRSLQEDGALFEYGPNAFLNNRPDTKRLIDGLGLWEQVIEADASAALRYILRGNDLVEVPSSPQKFLFSPLLSLSEKIRVLGEGWVKPLGSPEETVYNFAGRRFGRAVAETVFDPVVSGVYAGDIRSIIIKSAFPKIYTMEQEHGSVLRAMMASKAAKKPKAVLCSFKGGMQTLIDRLQEACAQEIGLNEEVKSLRYDAGKYIVQTNFKQYRAQKVVLSVPSYAAASFVCDYDTETAKNLSGIMYAPVAVVGLLYNGAALKGKPRGFGYLIPSTEQKPVLGVLFESDIFTGRCAAGQVLLRVMIGGARHPAILAKTRAELEQIAISEVKSTLRASANPLKSFYCAWPQGIPQYDALHYAAQAVLDERLKNFDGLYICANYYHGVGFNECIANSCTLSRQMAASA